MEKEVGESGTLFKCTFQGCSLTFDKPSAFETHQLSHSNERPFSCQFCNASFKVIFNLHKHEKLHEMKKPFECTVPGCAVAFFKKHQLSDHEKETHGINPEREKKLECIFENCTAKFDKKWKLDEHLSSHTGERPFLCQEPGCGKSFIRKTHLDRHLLSHSDERPFSCSSCASTFKCRSNLRKHEKIHLGKKPYSCSEEGCPVAFVKKTQLYSHLINDHKVASPFKCEICDTNFSNKSHLNRHTQRSHLAHFMCTDCYQKFDKFSALQKHISKEHRNLNRHYCSICNLTFKEAKNLNVHNIKTHANVESRRTFSVSSIEKRTEIVTPDEVSLASDTPSQCGSLVSHPLDQLDIFEKMEETFDCTVCDEVFKNKTMLTKHLKSAHGTLKITEYKCSECSGVFKHKPNLVKHIQSKHQGVKRFSCSECEMKFYYKQAYERHVSFIHSSKTKLPREAWNKTSEQEDLSGHFVDSRLKRYVEDMAVAGLMQKRNKLGEGDALQSDSVFTESKQIVNGS